MLTLPALTRLCRARDELRETLASPLPIHAAAKTARMSPQHFIRRFEAPSLYRRQIRSLIQFPKDPAEELFPGCLMLMSRLPLPIG